MPVQLNGSTSGSITLTAPAVAGTSTVTFPAASGTAVISGQNSAITSGTAQTLSGTAVTFTGIPSWVKRVTFVYSGVRTSGSSPVQIQVGAGSTTTTGYLTSSLSASSSVGTVNVTTGFELYNGGADTSSLVRHGTLVITNLAGDTWVGTGIEGCSSTTQVSMVGGTIALSGALDRVNITTINGTDTFTAGTVNVLYE